MKRSGNPFLDSLEQAAARLVPPGGCVVAAVSGGPDSCAMLWGWTRFARRYGHRLHIAHFDHAARTDSHADALYVQRLAAELGVPVHIDRADSTGRFSEELARNARYRFLNLVAIETGAGFVATGHTADDQVETILMAIVRGTGVHGLAGMPERRPLSGDENAPTLIRPMLGVRRDEAIHALQSASIIPRIDPSNRDRSFLRNRIRNELLPLLKAEYNANISEAISNLGAVAGQAAKLLQRQAEELFRRSVLHEEPFYVELSLPVLQAAGANLAAETVHWIVREKGWPRQGLGRKEIERIVGLLNHAQPRAWDLPGGLRAVRKRQTLRLSSKPQRSEEPT